MGCGKKKFRNTPLVNNPVYFMFFNEIHTVSCVAYFKNKLISIKNQFLSFFLLMDFGYKRLLCEGAQQKHQIHNTMKLKNRKKKRRNLVISNFPPDIRIGGLHWNWV
jgi:hypothetical protein